MNCIDYRRLITSEPSHVGADVLRHRLACPACAAFTGEMQELDTNLRAAMMTATPPALASRITLTAAGQTVVRQRWLGIAATLALVVGVTLTALNFRYRIENLPEQVIEHLYHEANLLVPESTELVPERRLREVLESTGVRLIADVDEVIHAGVCYFRGHLVSHLVVLSEQGPITVMLLPDENVKETMLIDEDGFNGFIVPVHGGSIAIIGSQAVYPAQLERQFSRAVEWTT